MHSRSLALRIALPALLLGLPYVLLPGYRVLRGDAHSQLGVPGVSFALLVLGFVGLASIPQMRSRIAQALSVEDCGGPDRPVSNGTPRLIDRIGLPLGLAFVVAVLAYLEWSNPYFFTEDDNVVQFLPTIELGARRLMAGELLAWNPHQMLGVPAASLGIYALTYPPTYLAYLVSRDVLGDPHATIDVFCIGHLIVGYLVTYRTARLVGLRGMLSAAASAAFVLSGYMLMGGRSWYYMTPVAVYAPLLVSSIVMLSRRNPNWKWASSTGLAVGLFFHAGNAQMWVYAVMFTVVATALLAVAGRVPWLRCAWLGVAIAVGVAVAAPLLVPQAAVAAQVNRTLDGRGILERLPALLVPYPLIRTHHPLHGDPRSWGAGDVDPWIGGQFYYSGSLFNFAGLAILASALVYGWSRRVVGANVWLVCACLALVLACGSEMVLWKVQSCLPGFRYFSKPIKYVAYIVLFMNLGGGLAVQRCCAASRRPGSWETGLALGVFALLAYHAVRPCPAFFTYGLRPYPSISSSLYAYSSVPGAESNYRAGSVTRNRCTTEGYFTALPHNTGSVHDVLSINGYEPLVATSEPGRRVSRLLRDDLVPSLRAYGVRTLVVRYDPEPGFPSDFAVTGFLPTGTAAETKSQLAEAAAREEARQVGFDGGAQVWEIAKPDPLAFATGNPDEPLPIKVGAQSVLVDVSPLPDGGSVSVNFIRWPQHVAYADGDPIGLGTDDWGRIAAHVPPSTQTLEVRYVPAWGRGFVVAAALLTLAVGAMLMLRQRASHAEAQEHGGG